jgi:hypothetical protein
MGYVIAVYQPKCDKHVELVGCVRSHMEALREEDLVSDVGSLMLRAQDGSIIEIFEWKSDEALSASHRNPKVRALWARFAECCKPGTLATLPEAMEPFPHFEVLETELPYGD